MMQRPFFTIVVPTFNRANIIVRTVTKILQQTFSDFELIIVDDGSTDDTVNVLKGIQSKDQRLKLIIQENKERGAARNNGYKSAAGSYVVFFDSDDIMHDNHLAVLHQNIQEQQLPEFIATKFDFIKEDGKHYSSDISGLRQGYYTYKLFLNGNPLACNVCIQREIPNLHLFEEDRTYAIKEDWMFLFQNLVDHKLFLIDMVTISMTDHPQRSMRSDNELIIRKTNMAFEWILEKINLSAQDELQLRAHVSYFCGIHSYLDNNRKQSINYALSAIRSGGFKMKYFILFIKGLIGRRIMMLFK